MRAAGKRHEERNSKVMASMWDDCHKIALLNLNSDFYLPLEVFYTEGIGRGVKVNLNKY